VAQKYVNRAAGLHTFKNELTSPDGAQIIADNVVIDRDNTIESRRGFAQFLDFGILESRAKQLLQYKNRLLLHYDDKLLFETPSAGFDAFSGTYSETEEGLRIKGIEANGNFYFTTSDGIKKISAKSGDDLTDLNYFITDAGAYRGIDFTALPNYDVNGFLTPNSNVAYRVVWGYNDANDNLILGYPSEIVSVVNIDLQESCVVSLKINIPSQIIETNNSQNYFFQIYRSNIKTPYDIQFDTEFRLVAEEFLSQNNLNAGYIDFIDDVPNSYRDTGPDLYTNEIAGEGNAQANAQPPFAKDICLFKGSMFYANTKTRHNQTINLISPDNFSVLSPSTKLYIANSGYVNSYTFRGVQQTSLVDFTSYIPASSSFTGKVAGMTTDVTLTATTSGLLSNSITLAGDGTKTVNTLVSDWNTANPTNTIVTPIIGIGTQIPSAGTSISLVPDLHGKYFFLHAANDIRKYYIWFDDLGSNEKHMIKFNHVATAGEFSLTILGETTASLPHDTTAEELKRAIEDLPSIDYVNVTGTIATNFVIEYGGSLEQTSVPLLFVTSTLTHSSGTVSIERSVVTAASKTANPIETDLVGKLPIRVDIKGLDKDGLMLQLQSIFLQDKYAIDFALSLNVYQITIINRESGAASLTESSAITVLTSTATPPTNRVMPASIDFDNPILGLGEQVPVAAEFDGQVTGMTTDVIIRADRVGTNGNTITIIADSIKDINTLILEWNLANPLKSVSLIDGNGSQVPTANISLAGGLDGFILKSSDPSDGIQLETTSKSIIKVLNANTHEIVNTFYLSLSSDLPGQISLQSKTLADNPFYIAMNEAEDNFNPTLALVETGLVASSDFGTKVLTVTWADHGMKVGDKVILFNPTGGLANEEINGAYAISNVNSVNSFNINISELSGTFSGYVDAFKGTSVSSNETKPNRIYYSKTDIPEAVPLLNYFDVGAKDSEIKRIIPLRDSLFVLKTEGVYRLSGANPSSFSVTLFDSSSPILAPDSPAVLNNQIYMLSTQGIVAVSDGGIDIMSRNIEDIIIEPTSNNYPNFSNQTFGIASESDRSYFIFLPENIDDETATQCFRFNIFTRAWTRWDMAKTCGIVKKSDDKIYFGAADINYVEQERKSFLRSDFADRQYDKEILGLLAGTSIEINNTFNISQYDIIYQEQYVTIARYNRLLQTLDNDPFLNRAKFFGQVTGMTTDVFIISDKVGVNTITLVADGIKTISDLIDDWNALNLENLLLLIDGNGLQIPTSNIVISGGSAPYVDLTASIGADMASKLTGLIGKIIGDDIVGTYTPYTGSNNKDELLTGFNKLIDELNVSDGVFYANYVKYTTLVKYESAIQSVSSFTNTLELLNEVPFIIGDCTIFNAINCFIEYAPEVINDASVGKQFSQAVLLFDQFNITKGNIGFRTDVYASRQEVEFFGEGNGDYGTQVYGEKIYGGLGNERSFRTYVPRNYQRGKYMILSFRHRLGRENFKLLGYSVTHEGAPKDRFYKR
jgi:hypothetical protein